MKNLNELRNEIDQIDDEILNFISKRFWIINEIREYKKLHKIWIIDETRHKEKLEQFKNFFKKKWINEWIWEDIFNILHYYSVEYQFSKDKSN